MCGGNCKCAKSKWFNEDGVEFEIVGYGLPKVGEHYIGETSKRILIWKWYDSKDDIRLILKPKVQKVTTPALAQKWADKNPDQIVVNGDGVLSKVSRLHIGSSFGAGLLEVMVGFTDGKPTWTPLTEIEI